MSIYQIIFLDKIPKSAAVNEGVKLAKRYGNKGSVGFVNAVLRKVDKKDYTELFEEKDNIKRIYINFCNPWPKGKHRKKRLTHTRQLEKYKTFLAEDGEIYFKTDDDDLFNGSLGYFEESGFKILDKTYDLHAEPIWDNNIETEHEKMFSEQGIKIKALIAKKL